MQQLPFCPQPNYKVKSQPRRKTFDFGDGYQQRQVDGLNPLQRKYNVSFYLKNKKAVALIAFLNLTPALLLLNLLINMDRIGKWFVLAGMKILD
ncbi:phage tail protein [Actinobacillus suis]|uniref:phage tail protein n=1 Tax=Actinobacillus suis TaxID=716 RepID=UPI00207C6019|nr:phage tail protein [Actinobacillus suis]MCO4167072.1 phage tail protein [Actinobacillus suis]UTH24866.1 phage tail protein [Actinobacillus suis]